MIGFDEEKQLSFRLVDCLFLCAFLSLQVIRLSIFDVQLIPFQMKENVRTGVNGFSFNSPIDSVNSFPINIVLNLVSLHE